MPPQEQRPVSCLSPCVISSFEAPVDFSFFTARSLPRSDTLGPRLACFWQYSPNDQSFYHDDVFRLSLLGFLREPSSPIWTSCPFLPPLRILFSRQRTRPPCWSRNWPRPDPLLFAHCPAELVPKLWLFSLYQAAPRSCRDCFPLGSCYFA